MIGLIVTGQGHFASGLSEALEEISGKPEYFCALDYEKDRTPEWLSMKLNEALDSMKECDGVLILTDLVGGEPYKTSVEAGHPRGCEVIAGTNLGLLVEMNAARAYYSDIKQLADQALTVGKDQVQRFVYNPAGANRAVSDREEDHPQA